MALIGGEPMIVQVWRRAMESGVGDVVVACDGEEIAQAIAKAGGRAVITDPDHPSGSDRIWEALDKTGFEGDIIINLQGDVPTLEPRLLRELLRPLENPAVDIATLAAPILRNEEHENPSVVKAVLALEKVGNIGRALYFTRATAPYGDGLRYHHIGVYAYRRTALKTFVSLPPSPLELREKLEQLRALEAGLRIDVVVVDTVPLGVDTAEDLARAQEILNT
jgi:3-deoxy-manno-octulosonate cytidylyltransferase (CMP-KDO synthetase)